MCTNCILPLILFIHIYILPISIQHQDGNRLTIIDAMETNSGLYSCQHISRDDAVVVTDIQINITCEFAYMCVCECLCVCVSEAVRDLDHS